MLARTYRLTDKLGVMLIKSSAAATETLALGMATLLGTAPGKTGGLFGVVRGIARLLWRIVKLIYDVLRFVVGLVFGMFVAVGRVFGRLGGRTARTAATAATGAAGNAMARRAARVEMKATVAEDPLRVQNRLLSGITVLLMVGLLAVIVWATNPSRNVGVQLPVAGVIPPGAGGGLGETPSPGAPVNIATNVPTATELPSALQARGSLAYVVRERGQTDIWAVNVGSRTPIRITNDPADERDPAWSPDGTQLAYATREYGNWDIVAYNLVTGLKTHLTYGLEFNANPVWSPDGAFIAYESYLNGNLDVYLVTVDGTIPPQRLTTNPQPDFAPAWSAANGGREIAFVSWRDGNQDLYVVNLDDIVSLDTPDQNARNITNTPSRQENNPAWSLEGEWIAYSAWDVGVEKVFYSAPDGTSQAQLFAQGRTPAWSPDSNSIIYAVDSVDSTQLLASPFNGSGVPTMALQAPLGATDVAWSSQPLPVPLVNSGGLPLGVTSELYIERSGEPDGDPPYGLVALPGVEVEVASLSERVDDSFNALRQSVNTQSGQDFLGVLEHAFWDISRPTDPGVPRRSWHMTGRAFAIPRDAVLGFPPEIEIVREDVGVQTYWRVYLREPLRMMPWDFGARDSGDVQAYNQGGRLRRETPSGYFIDLTQLAQDYGWERLPAGDDWLANVQVLNWWIFYKPDGLTWIDAMRELYTAGQMGGFLPTATPAAVPTQGG
jgi:TolB protein